MTTFSIVGGLSTAISLAAPGGTEIATAINMQTVGVPVGAVIVVHEDIGQSHGLASVIGELGVAVIDAVDHQIAVVNDDRVCAIAQIEVGRIDIVDRGQAAVGQVVTVVRQQHVGSGIHEDIRVHREGVVVVVGEDQTIQVDLCSAGVVDLKPTHHWNR